MEKNGEGKIAMTKIALRPAITFSLTPPNAAELAALHHDAHAKCYIANSIRAEVVVEGAP
jgi:organic hydroperoxide reductase OsmC/OhrA